MEMGPVLEPAALQKLTDSYQHSLSECRSLGKLWQQIRSSRSMLLHLSCLNKIPLHWICLILSSLSSSSSLKLSQWLWSLNKLCSTRENTVKLVALQCIMEIMDQVQRDLNLQLWQPAEITRQTPSAESVQTRMQAVAESNWNATLLDSHNRKVCKQLGPFGYEFWKSEPLRIVQREHLWTTWGNQRKPH